MKFVNFSIAKKLKEKGFKEECLCHYIGDDLVYNIESPIANNQLWFSHNKFDNIWHRDNYDAPTISQVLKWLREEKKILITIIPQEKNLGHDTLCFCVYRITEDLYQPIYNGTINTLVDSYEETAIAGIEYVLDNLI